MYCKLHLLVVESPLTLVLQLLRNSSLWSKLPRRRSIRSQLERVSNSYVHTQFPFHVSFPINSFSFPCSPGEVAVTSITSPSPSLTPQDLHSLTTCTIHRHHLLHSPTPHGASCSAEDSGHLCSSLDNAEFSLSKAVISVCVCLCAWHNVIFSHPHRILVETVNALRPQDMMHLRPYTYSNIAEDPLILLHCDKRVFRSVDHYTVKSA